MAVATGDIRRATWPAERRFFLTMAIVIGLVVFVGFARSFYLFPLFPGRPAPSEHFFRLHGTAYTAWFVLLIVQASLIAGRNVRLHRRLGVAGACLAAAMVVLGTIGGLIGAARPGGFIGVDVPPLIFLVVPLAEAVLFGTLMTLAIAKRNVPQTHKRLVLIASISLLSAAFARWPLIGALGPLGFFGACDLLIVALAVWDFKSLGHLHPVTKWAGAITILSQPARLALGGTALWAAFAGWAVGLVG